MNVLDVLKYGDTFFMQALGGVGEAGAEKKGAVGTWSIKDVVSHMASYEHMLVDVLNSVIDKNAKTPHLNGVMKIGPDKINDYWVEGYKDKSLKEVVEDYKKAHKKVMRVARKVPAERWIQNGVLPWYGKQYSLNDYIVYTSYGHKREHGAQISASAKK